MRSAAVILFVVALGAPVTARAASGATSWLGVTLGMPLSAVRAQLGDPLLYEELGDGLRKSGYLSPDGDAFIGVDDKDGKVVEITIAVTPLAENGRSLIADPFGLKVGDSKTDVVSKRGAAPKTDNDARAERLIYPIAGSAFWEYVVRSGRVEMILLVGDVAATAAGLPVREHFGRSFEDAIVVKAPNEKAGVLFEHVYLAINECGKQGHWTMTSQALMRKQGHPYDKLGGKCTVGGEQRDFYFDIAPYFGKM